MKAALNLGEEARLIRDGDEAGVRGPERPNALIEPSGLVDALVARGVTALDDGVTARRRALKEEHGVVAGELSRVGRTHAGEELVGGPRPVGGTVDGAAVAQEHTVGVLRRAHILEVALHVKDRALRRAPAVIGCHTREAAREQQRGRLGYDNDPLSHLASEEVGRGRLAAARTAREHDLAGGAMCLSVHGDQCTKSANMRALVMRPPLATMTAVLAVGLTPWGARGHGANPRVTALVTAPASDSVWLVTDVQGLFGLGGQAGTRWLCEDAVAPNAGFVAVAPTQADDRAWLVATVFGLSTTENGGCDFAPVEGPLGSAYTLGLFPSATDPLDVLTVTAAPGATNDVWRTRDGGLTWRAAGLRLEGAPRALVRSPVAPERVWLSTEVGHLRSADGGESFTPFALEFDGERPAPGAVYLFGGPADLQRASEVWAAVQRLPATVLLRSSNGGDSWSVAARVPDPVGSLALHPVDARSGLLTTVFGGVWRTRDGQNWAPVDDAIAGLGCLRSPRAGEPLRACADTTAGAPWAAAESDDFGETWRPLVTRLSDTRARWGCAAGSPTATACADLCPGAPAGAACMLCDAPSDCLADAGVRDADAGVRDADAPEVESLDAARALDTASMDATRLAPDLGPVVASVAPPTIQATRQGCSLALSRGDAHAVGLLTLALGAAYGVRRRRGRRAGLRASP